MSRAERTQEIERLKGELGEVRNAVLIDYRGITVPQVTDLRVQVRNNGGRYAVVKNTLLQRAVADAPLGRLKDQMRGPIALIWSDAEPAPLAKALSAFMKTVPAIQVKAILLEGQMLPADGLETVARMPTREEARAQLVSVLAAPMRRLVTVLSAPSRGLASVLKQRADQEKS